MVASQDGHTETVNMLLEHGSGAEMNIANKVRNMIHECTFSAKRSAPILNCNIAQSQFYQTKASCRP